MDKLMSKLGFNMDGVETAFYQHIELALAFKEPGFPFRYYEIGIAEGKTLLAVADFLEAKGVQFYCTGVDLLNGPFFKATEFIRNCRHTFCIRTSGAIVERVNVVLIQDKRLEPCPNQHFVLIDGCHGAPCVEADFLSVAPFVAKGGIVAFHDACKEDQGSDYQDHCKQPINVRYALGNLRLLYPLFAGGLAGWKFLGEAHGDKQATPKGNGFAFFQKIG